MKNSDQTAKNMTELIWLVRKLYHRLRSMSEDYYAKHALNAAKRSLLEDLDRYGSRSISEIAEAKAPVSRQYIQRLVAELVEAGFVSLTAHERDRRSKVVALTQEGVGVLAAIRPKEHALVRELANNFEGPEIENALVMMQSILHLVKPNGPLARAQTEQE